MARLVTIRRGSKTARSDLAKLYALPRHTDRKICITRKLGGIGDVIMSTVALRGLREKYPNAHITYAVCDKWGHNGDSILLDLLKGNPYINEVVPITPPSNPQMTQLQADHHVVIDITGQELAVEKKGKCTHRIDFWCERLKVAPRSKIPDFFLTDDEIARAKAWLKKNKVGSGAVAIQAKCYGAVRNWPVDRLKEVARYIADDLKRDVIIFSDNEGDNYPAYNRWHNRCGGSIRDNAAVLKQCSMIIGADSGLLHLAGALRVPILGLFGSVPPRSRLGYYVKADWIWHSEMPCAGCYYRHDCPPHKGPYKPCMDKITSDEVMFQVRRKLREDNKTITADQMQKRVVDIRKTPYQVKTTHKDKPRILVAMLTFNGLGYTRKAQESLKSVRHDFDRLVVDNYSDDGTFEYLVRQGIPFVRKETSVAGACNIAMQEMMSGGYDYLFILNNDVELTNTYIDTVIDEYQKLKDCAFLTGVTLNVEPRIKVGLEKLIAERKTEQIDNVFYTGEFSAFCIDRDTVEKVGMFDEAIYFPRYVEDDDYAHRVRLAGLKMYRTGKTSFVHHVGKTIAEVVPTKDHKWKHDYSHNLLKYIEKWGDGPNNLTQTPEGRALINQGYGYSGGKFTNPYNDPTDSRNWACRYETNHGPKNVLILQPQQMGDVVLSLPLASELKKRYPLCNITWGINPKLRSLFESVPYVDNLMNCTDADIHNMVDMYKGGEVYDRIYVPNISAMDSNDYEKGDKDFVTYTHSLAGIPSPCERKPEFVVPSDLKKYTDSLMDRFKNKKVVAISLHSYSQILKLDYQKLDQILDRLQQKHGDIEYIYLGGPGENYKGKHKVTKINNDKLGAIPEILRRCRLIITANSGNLWISCGIPGLPIVDISASVAKTAHHRNCPGYLEKHLLRKVGFKGVKYIDIYDRELDYKTIGSFMEKAVDDR